MTAITAEEILESLSSVIRPKIRQYGYHVADHMITGIDFLASPDTNEIFFIPEIIELYERARILIDRPIPITAGYRTLLHENNLRTFGYKTAKLISAHTLGAAIDSDAGNRDDNLTWMHTLKIAARDIELPTPRFGFSAYGGRFVHTDMVFMLFEPYTGLKNPLPDKWRPGITW